MVRRSSTFTITLAAAAASAALLPAARAGDNPFAMEPLARGYMVADADKAPEGKCGMGKCGSTMKMIAKDSDGAISKQEYLKHYAEIFDALDKNHDGKLDPSEMAKMMQGKCGQGKCGAAK